MQSKVFKQATGLLAPLLVVLSVGAAHATTIKGFTTRSMVGEAAAVVRGTVIDKVSVYNADKSRIYTDSRIKVRTVLSGRATESTITLRQIGGTVDGVSMHVEGVAPIAKGEEVVLFLRTDGKRWYTVGMAQGKYAVHIAKDGKEVVSREVAGLKRVQLGKRLSGHKRAPRWDQPRKSYLEFATEVQGFAKELGK